MRVVVFFFIAFALVFGSATFLNQGNRMAFGWHSFTTYGWPQPWLHIHVTDKTTWVNGTLEPGERTTKRSVAWQPFIVSAGTSAGIAVALSALVYFGFTPKEEV